jgi:hypothetical protein
MINGTSGYDSSCRRYAAAGHLRAATCETLVFPLHSIDNSMKILSGECNDNSFATHNALTMRHPNQSGRLNPHSPCLLIANRLQLRGFLP